jgi:two-component system C4-dicarboxylate transport response regulator DctD
VNQPKKSVVLVDDDKVYADLMIEMIEMSLDCKVHAFTRPLEALKAIQNVDPGVVVTDYNMPQLNGLEFIRKASPLIPRANFVLITGHDLSAYKDEMDRLGALKGFLAKPFGSRKLADEIRRVWPNNGASPATDATSV